MKEKFTPSGKCQFAGAQLQLDDKVMNLTLKGAIGGEYALIIKSKDGEKIADIFEPKKFDFTKSVKIDENLLSSLRSVDITDINTEEVMASFALGEALKDKSENKVKETTSIDPIPQTNELVNEKVQAENEKKEMQDVEADVEIKDKENPPQAKEESHEPSQREEDISLGENVENEVEENETVDIEPNEESNEGLDEKSDKESDKESDEKPLDENPSLAKHFFSEGDEDTSHVVKIDSDKIDELIDSVSEDTYFEDERKDYETIRQAIQNSVKEIRNEYSNIIIDGTNDFFEGYVPPKDDNAKDESMKQAYEEPKPTNVLNDDCTMFLSMLEYFGAVNITGKDIELYNVDFNDEATQNACIIIGKMMKSFMHPYETALLGSYDNAKLLFGCGFLGVEKCLFYVIAVRGNDLRIQSMENAGFNILSQSTREGDNIYYYYYAVSCSSGEKVYI